VKIRKADVWLVCSLLVAAAVLFGALYLFSPRGAEAVVSVNGDEHVRLPLSCDTEYELVLDGVHTHTIVVSEGEVSVSYAVCPDRICVHHAPVARSGETVVCLPYRVSVTVEEGGTHG
jgi:hypothetical protein